MKNVISKKMFLIGGFIILIIALVLFRTLDRHHFRNDLTKWAKPSVTGENVLSLSSLSQIDNPLLIILDKSQRDIKGEIINVDPAKITQKETIEKIREYKGSVVLIADDAAVAAKAWMILSQMGLNNLFLLDANENEKFRYEFRPDSVIRPEI